MKKYIQYNKVILVLLLVIASYQFTNAQISNGGINYELRVDQFYQAYDNDGVSNDDHQWRIGINSDANTGGSTSWPSTGPGGGCAANNYGYRWQADAPSNSGANLNILLYTGTNRSGTSTFNIAGESWEEDGGWDCSGSGDAGVWIGNYNVSFNTATKTPALWWGPDDVAGGEWISEDWAVTSGTRNGDARIKTAWRYTYGYDCSNPLDFGTITVGAAAKTHLNTNRVVPTGGSANVGYANVAGNTAPDVYYTFTITTDATVVISTVSGSTNYDSYLRLYNSDCSNQLAFNDDFSGLQAQITQYLCAGTYKILVEGTGGTPTGNFLLSVSANTTTPAVPVSPAAGTFGTNQWYVYGYNGGTLDLTGTYKGYYTETALSYNTSGKWDVNFSPSYAPGWNGNCVNLDNHVVVSKRQGFPCAVYQLNVPSHDDDIRVYINGAASPTWSHEPGCCDPHTNIWTGYLTSTSTIEVRHIDGAGGSNQELTFTNVTSTLNGGTIAGITTGANVCQGTDPGAFTSSVNASGGTIGITNGSPSAHSYQWQRATDAAFTVGVTNVGINATTYDPDNSLTGGTYYFRRRVTDACGTIAYSNTIQINIIHNISATPPTAAAASGGTCTQWRANWSAVTGATSYRLDVATDAGFTSMVSGFSSLNVGNVTSYDLNLPLGTYYYRVRAVNSCFTSSNSGTISFTLANVGNNDAFKNAIDISSTINAGNVYNASFTNDGYGTEGGEPTPNGIYSTAWYKFTTGAVGIGRLDAYITQTGNSDNPALGIYRSNAVCPFNLTQLADEWWCGSGDGSDYTTCLTPYTTYYLQFGTNDCTLDGGDNGTFNISITPIVAAPDNICNAVRVGAGDIGVNQSATTSTYTNSCSSVNTGGYGDPGNADGNDATDWFYFTTPSVIPDQYFFKFNNIADFGTWGALEGEVYKKTGGTCPPTLSYIGSWDPDLCGVEEESGGFCLEPSTTYYIMPDEERDGLCGGRGRYQLRVRGSNSTAGPDNACSAVSMGTLDGLTASLSLSNQSNNCAGTQTNEPGGGQKTVWYTFTTGNTVAKDFNITVDANSNGMDAEVYVYEACSPPICSGSPAINLNAGEFSELANFWNGLLVPALGIGEWDASGTISGGIKPNTTYYIRVDGVDLYGGLSGNFNLSVSFSGGAYNANDDFCNAFTAGNATQVTGTTESVTNNDILDLGETITVGTFNNKSASAQEACALDEPNNDEDDETVWFKFVTSATPGSEIEIDVNAINDGNGGLDCIGGLSYAWTKVYVADGSPVISCPTFTNSTNWFAGIVEAGRDDLVDASKYYIDCPAANTTYYIQVENQGIGCDRSSFTMTVKDNGIFQAPNDRICNAVVLSTPTYTNPQALVGTYTKHTIVNQNNFCATNTGEPTPACFGTNNQAVWYKLPAAAAPGAGDISNPGRKVAIINARSNHAGGSEDEINLQLALYSNSNMASCPTNPTTGFTLTTDIQGNNCAYVGPASLDLDQLFQYSEYLTSACLTPATDYYMMVDGESLPLNIDFDALKKGWFEFDAYYPREIGDLPCNAVPFKTWGIPGTPAANTSDNLFNNSNLCTTYTPGIGANQEPPTTFTTGDGNDNPGWVYFYAPASGSVKITATADPNDIMKDGVFDNIDLQLAIFQEKVIGTCSTVEPPQSPVNSIVSYNVLDGYGEEMYVNCLTPGRKYFLMVDGSASPLTQTRGIFDLKIEDFAANSYATNDEMQNAIAFTNTYTATATWNRINYKVTETISDSKNWCADNLNEPGRPALGGYNETGVWYKFIAPPSGMVHILAENTNYATLTKPSGDPNHLDLSLAVYQLNTGYTASQYSIPAATTLIKQEYDNILVTNGVAIAGTTAEDEEMVVECLTPGKEYYLLVSGKKSSGIGSDWDYGRFNLAITAHPRNPAMWNGTYVTNGGFQYLPPSPVSIDSVCNAANLGTMPAGSAWFQPFGNRQVPANCGSNFYQSPTFNNFCATATNDPSPGYQQDLVNVFGGNHKPVWFKFTTPATGAFDASRISVEVDVISGDCDAGILDDWYDSGCTPSDEEYQDCINIGVSVWLPNAVPALCNTPLYEMDSDFDFDVIPAGEQADIHCLDPSTTYYIMVDGGSTNQEGNFNVRVRQITPDPRPVNNYICDAKKLTTGAITSPASFWGAGAAFRYDDELNICADTRKDALSASGTEPVPSGWDVVSPPSDANDMTHTVWYTFRTPAAAADYAVQIDVNSQLPWPFGDLVNPKIAVWEAQDNTCSYTHPNGPNMVEMASEYDPLAFWTESINVYCLQPDKQYYVQVGGTSGVYGQDQGYFDIIINDISPIAIPVNDAVCSAVNMGTLPAIVNNKLGDATSGANNYHNYCTDLEAGEPVPGAFTPDNTVWFKFTTPATAGKRYNVTINANSDPAPKKNDNINLQLALYESSGGCTFANFTEMASDFDGLIYSETLTATCLKPSTTYYIQVDGSKGLLELFRAQGFGYFGIEVITTSVYDAPVNDNMCNATNLGTIPVAGQLAPATWYYNSCATLELNETDPVGDVIDYGIDKTVWFKFVPGRDADFKISAISDCLIGAGCDPVDLQVALFRPSSGSAPACPTYAEMVQEAADYDPVFFDEDLTAPCLKQGQTYYIQVDGSAVNVDGEFQIKVEDRGSSSSSPANDNFCAATLMTFTAGVANLTNQSNVCATIQASEPNTPASVQKSVWYKFQAPPSGRIRITTHDADGPLRGLDPEFYVYENGASFNCSAFSNLSANGSAYNPIPDIPIISPNIGDDVLEDECFVPGWWYLIQVDGTTVGGPQGKFDIKIEDLLTPYTVVSGNKPSNDDFASAKSLTIQTEACSEGTGRTDLHGSGTWDPENYGKSTRDMINGLGSAGCSVSELCGDLWYKFVVTSPGCNNGYSPMIIQGKAKSTLLEGSKLHLIAYKGSAGALTVLGCGTASSSLTNDAMFNFEINEAIGTTVYLQIFGEDALDWNENFELCVSEKRGFDYCAHAAASPPMTYDVEYCYNIKGATLEPSASAYAESCPLTGIPGVPDPDSDAPTENSVYFKFVTDNSCSDYRLNFKYNFDSYSALSNKGISYSIYKDDTPCDGAALGSGSLDCQSFYNTNAGSFEYTILFSNNNYLETPVGVDNNSTYYIQIDGPGNNFGNLDGTIKITQVPICLPIVVDSVPSTVMSTYFTCNDGWQHYYNVVGGKRKYKFSVFTNGNNIKGTATVTYDPSALFISKENCPRGYAEYVMRRRWDFVLTPGFNVINPANPVKIRFYYIAKEKQDIITQAQTTFPAACPSQYEPFEWFKSENGHVFDPILDVSEKVISVGPNGYSQTGCFSYWDASGIFIPSGVNRCNTLTVLDNQFSCNNIRYVEYQGLTGFSGGTGGTGDSPWDISPLPVELTSFTGYNDGDKNVLNWTTASEINTLKFEVERSPQSINAVFTYIGELPAAGSSNVPLSYSLNDNNPISGDNYYRLKMIDIDGTFKYSQTIFIRNDKDVTYVNAINGIYPNPTNHLINIDYQSAANSKVEIKILNVVGQDVLKTEMNTQKGNQLLQMDVSSFANGVYIINIRDIINGSIKQSKFIKD